MQHVFIIGSKGIPAKYGGFETFVDKLTSKKKSEDIQYYVSCLSETEEKEVYYNNALCFHLKVNDIGSAKAISYDLKSLSFCINYIKKNNLENCVIYILACRIGPFLPLYLPSLKKLNIKLYVNPDGHEWKRSKWNKYVKAYWKFSEKLMVKFSDLLICDSKAIEKYIQTEYHKYQPKTTFISYGADLPKNIDNNYEKGIDWYKKHEIVKKDYYLIVGRFVPENNYELIITEFMKSDSKKDLVIITNIEKNTFYNHLLNKTKFNQDKRIKFVGTVYDQELLMDIRRNAYGYIHGHEVGGTNPSLLEALATTDLNLVLNVEFNTEVTTDSALFFTKSDMNLANTISAADLLTENEITILSEKAKKRILHEYSWDKIVNEYEQLFL